jgi:hypothetical protein
MARYIDADKLWNDRPLIPEGKSQDYGAGFSECMFGFSERIRKQIDNPTADFVEVVRCQNCQCRLPIDESRYKYKGTSAMYCFIHARLCHENDFCSYGKRKQE